MTSNDLLIPSDETLAELSAPEATVPEVLSLIEEIVTGTGKIIPHDPLDDLNDADLAAALGDESVDDILTELEASEAAGVTGDFLPTESQKQTAVQKMMDATELVNKTVFLKTRFGSLGNSRKVTGSDVLTTDADVSLLKVNKTLLESPELEAIKKADGAMRAWLYNTCLPFDMGIMLLPIGLVEVAEAKMKEYRSDRAAMVEAFLKTYDFHKQQAQAQLGTLYKESDYPSVGEIKARFVFEWQYTSFSVPGSLKNISAALFEAEKEKQAATMQAATEEITSIMRGHMLKLVTHLQEKLTPGDDGKSKILRETAITNLTDFLATFDLRNVTDDKELAAIVAKAKELVSGTSATAVRTSDALKASLLKGMDSIVDSLNGMVEVKAGRLFKDED